MNKTILILIFLSYASSVSAADIVRKTELIRGKDYAQNIFYKGDKEIARFKSSPKGIYERKGWIPDGKVIFSDSFRKTYGEENWRNGQRHGLLRAFYPDGQLKTESQYDEGTLVWTKEYSRDGRLRLTADYSDALDCPGNKETGEGKIYFDDGAIKYQWSFTRTLGKGSKKAFTQDGQVRYEAIFNGRCEMVTEKRPLEEGGSMFEPMQLNADENSQK